MEVVRTRPKLLMLGADALVWDSVRVMLGSMGYHCVVASTLKEALSLLKVQKPDVAILDPRQVGSPPALAQLGFVTTREYCAPPNHAECATRPG